MHGVENVLGYAVYLLCGVHTEHMGRAEMSVVSRMQVYAVRGTASLTLLGSARGKQRELP